VSEQLLEIASTIAALTTAAGIVPLCQTKYRKCRRNALGILVSNPFEVVKGKRELSLLSLS